MEFEGGNSVGFGLWACELVGSKGLRGLGFRV